MSEPLVRDLEMEEALQEEIKDTIEHKINHMVNGVLKQTRKKYTHIFFLTLYVIINYVNSF